MIQAGIIAGDDYGHIAGVGYHHPAPAILTIPPPPNSPPPPVPTAANKAGHPEADGSSSSSIGSNGEHLPDYENIDPQKPSILKSQTRQSVMKPVLARYQVALQRMREESGESFELNIDASDNVQKKVGFMEHVSQLSPPPPPEQAPPTVPNSTNQQPPLLTQTPPPGLKATSALNSCDKLREQTTPIEVLTTEQSLTATLETESKPSGPVSPTHSAPSFHTGAAPPSPTHSTVSVPPIPPPLPANLGNAMAGIGNPL